MEGLKFINNEDLLNRWRVDTVLLIVSKVQQYCMEHNLINAYLHSVEDNRWSDPKNGRFDIEIRYINENGNLIQQKLLYLRGEILDGNEFHKRHDEFYPREVS